MMRHYPILNRAATWFGAAALLLGGSQAIAADCNGNGIPDDVEIASCPGIPSCGDCNLNGIPDGCDIAEGSSFDANGDGIPDECVFARDSGNWTSNIWGLPGGDYPDDVGHVAGVRVTLPTGVIVFLDDTVVIRGLRLEQEAILRVTQSGAGDLTIVNQTTGGGLLNQGTIFVAHDRRIDVVGGEVILGEGGLYVRDPAATTPVSATLTAGTLTMFPTFCGGTEQLTLSSRMSLATIGDLVMDGRGIVPCPFSGGSTADTFGGKTPPILSVVPESSSSAGATAANGLAPVTRIAVSGGVRLLETASVCIGCTALATDPLQVVQVAGGFDNQLNRPSFFHWTKGGLTLAGPGPHSFEVAGFDLGPTPGGFSVKQPTAIEDLPHSNFSMGTVRVEGQVRFANTVPNTAGAGACQEALYVDTLVLSPGSLVTLDNCKVYYNRLQDEGGVIEKVGCGDLVAISIPTVSEWGLIAMAALLVVAAGVVCKKRIATSA